MGAGDEEPQQRPNWNRGGSGRRGARRVRRCGEYVKERKASGGPIGDFQLVREMIAQSALEIDAARLLTLRAAHLRTSASTTRWRCRWPSSSARRWPNA